MTDIPDPLSEAEALAAEHALGVLSEAERAAAESRMARDPVFAALVEDWRRRLQPLADAAPPIEPPEGLWSRIERRLPANDAAPVASTLRFWRGTAMGALALAAASLLAVVVLVSRGPVLPSPRAPAPILNASLASPGKAQPLFVASYDPARRALIVTSLVPAGADPRHVHQLWLIPGDGKPRSLGVVEPGVSKALAMPAPLETLIGDGAQLAVSVEPPGGSTRPDGPSGPIAATGRLSKI